jgi:hypothetical protein
MMLSGTRKNNSYNWAKHEDLHDDEALAASGISVLHEERDGSKPS